jgi:hypothetical protein
MIFFAAQDGTGAVELFGEDESYQLMREYQFRKAPFMIGSFEHGIGESVCTTDQKHEAFTAFIGALLNEVG